MLTVAYYDLYIGIDRAKYNQKEVKKYNFRQKLRENAFFYIFFCEKICSVRFLPYICTVKTKRWIHLRARIHASHA